MIVRDLKMNPIRLAGTRLSPFQIAQLCYLRWRGDTPFWDDLADYLANGIVISRHDIFMMAKVVDLAPLDKDGKPIPPTRLAWFIRMAVGSVATIAGELPCTLPEICFCRRNDGKPRVYPFARIVQIAIREGK